LEYIFIKNIDNGVFSGLTGKIKKKFVLGFQGLNALANPSNFKILEILPN